MSLDLISNKHQNNLKEVKSSDSAVYEFEDFRLDATHLMLYRNGEEISLTPKQVETLLALVERSGEILSKEFLMERLWANAFVEESNLNQNIYVLRKTLGETSDGKPMIETLRRRGYRFNGELKAHTQNEFAPERQPEETATLSTFPTVAGDKVTVEKPYAVNPSGKKRMIAAFALITLLIVGIAVGGWFVRGRQPTNEAPLLSAPFALEKLLINGKVFNAAISPDGKNVVYTNVTLNEKQSVWVRNLETGNNVEIIPPSDSLYFGLAFSPDGNLLYFARRTRNIEGQADIYRIPLFGGVPQKILGETQGWMSFSPDGKKISFVRCFYKKDDCCSLWIADSADGLNEKKLVTRPSPVLITDNEFSPDGKLIAFASGRSDNYSTEFGLSAFDIESGVERELTTEKFFHIRSLAWLPNQKSLLLTTSKIPNKNVRIWQVSIETGKAEIITKDSDSYSDLSLDKTATRLVATKILEDYRLRVLDLENASETLVLPNASSVTYAPDGKIFYISSISGSDEIWSTNADGSNQKQLTNDSFEERMPVVAPDNSTIYFASNRTGSLQVWRMNADGSNQTQVTRKNGGLPLFVSPNGEWVYFLHGTDKTLWRVSTKGEEQMILNKGKYYFTIAPDGSLVAYIERDGNENVFFIASLTDGQKVKAYRLADPKTNTWIMAWMPDWKGLAYILPGDEYRKNTLWLQPFDEKEAPRKIADFDEKIAPGSALAISPDGKQFAVVQGDWRHDAVLLTGLK